MQPLLAPRVPEEKPFYKKLDFWIYIILALVGIFLAIK
jgi:hypothetical protein